MAQDNYIQATGIIFISAEELEFQALLNDAKQMQIDAQQLYNDAQAELSKNSSDLADINAERAKYTQGLCTFMVQTGQDFWGNPIIENVPAPRLLKNNQCPPSNNPSEYAIELDGLDVVKANLEQAKPNLLNARDIAYNGLIQANKDYGKAQQNYEDYKIANMSAEDQATLITAKGDVQIGLEQAKLEADKKAEIKKFVGFGVFSVLAVFILVLIINKAS